MNAVRTPAVTVIVLNKVRAVYGDRRARVSLALACCLTVGCAGGQSRLAGENAEQVMRDVRSAEEIFSQRHARYGGWKELVDAGLSSGSLENGTAFRYRFDLHASGKRYQCVGVPAAKDDSMDYVGWSFFVDESGIIRGSPYGRANGYAVADTRTPPIRSQ